MNNNNFENIPRPKYIKEYKKFGTVFGPRKYGEKSFWDRFLLQSFVSLVAIAAILLVNNIDIGFTNIISNGIRTTINWNMDFSKVLGTFKNFENIIPEAKENLGVAEVGIESFEDNPSFILPVEGEITSEFGERIHPVFKTVKMHNGIDINAEIGTPIKSSSAGTVTKVGEDEINGKYISIKSDKYDVIYAHCYKIIVKEGQKVQQGEMLGETGDTGITSGPHLHFEIQEAGKSVSPMEMLTEIQ
ncbi:MAG: M23 family metallopeptidase [Clostridiaceae bacterium]|nr:M23 family metallopeptidase [Clostridiaceae bacterium]